MTGRIYKALGVALVLYSLVYGLLTSVPDLPIIEQSIRNLFYHVSMWFAMVGMMAGSFGNAVGFLRSDNLQKDRRSESLAETGMLFAFLGLFTGMMWAKFTWGLGGQMIQSSTVVPSLYLYTSHTSYCATASKNLVRRHVLAPCTTYSLLS